MTSNHEKSYFYALGQFVHAFSMVETTLHQFFSRFADMPPLKARAIKREMNIAALIKIIKNLLTVGEFTEENRKDAENIFQHLDHITTFRDRLIHKGASETDTGDFESTNISTMRTLEHLDIMRFKITDIRNATIDLKMMTYRIMKVASDLPREVFAKRAFAPWRYKPVKLETPNRSLGKIQKPPRQR